jgi:hypothetical protein
LNLITNALRSVALRELNHWGYGEDLVTLKTLNLDYLEIHNGSVDWSDAWAYEYDRIPFFPRELFEGLAKKVL